MLNCELSTVDQWAGSNNCRAKLSRRVRLVDQVSPEPVESAFPAVFRRGFVIGGPHVAVESVLRTRIADDLVGGSRLAVERRAELLDVRDGDAAVLVAEESEPGGSELGG